MPFTSCSSRHCLVDLDIQYLFLLELHTWIFSIFNLNGLQWPLFVVLCALWSGIVFAFFLRSPCSLVFDSPEMCNMRDAFFYEVLLRSPEGQYFIVLYILSEFRFILLPSVEIESIDHIVSTYHPCPMSHGRLQSLSNSNDDLAQTNPASFRAIQIELIMGLRERERERVLLWASFYNVIVAKGLTS